MHGSMGGSWKRSTRAKATAVGHPDGKPQELEGRRAYRRNGHRASSRPYRKVLITVCDHVIVRSRHAASVALQGI
jgi:hypothetical protein